MLACGPGESKFICFRRLLLTVRGVVDRGKHSRSSREFGKGFLDGVNTFGLKLGELDRVRFVFVRLTGKGVLER